MELITIKESHHTNDLSVLKSRIESVGISCFIKDEYSNDILQHIPYMSAKLQIYSSDLPKVKDILIEYGIEINDTLISCPYCNSNNISPKSDIKSKVQYYLRYMSSQFRMQDTNKVKRNFTCNHCFKDFLT